MPENKYERSPNCDKENKTPKKLRIDDTAGKKLNAEKIKGNKTMSNESSSIYDVQSNRTNNIYKKNKTPDKIGGRSMYHSKCCTDEQYKRPILVPKIKTRVNTSTDSNVLSPEKSGKRQALKRKLEDNLEIICIGTDEENNSLLKETNIETPKSPISSKENVPKTEVISIKITEDKNPTEAAKEKNNKQTNKIIITNGNECSEYIYTISENTDKVSFWEPSQQNSEIVPLLKDKKIIEITPLPDISKENTDGTQEPVDETARISGLVQQIDANIVPAVHLGHPGVNQNEFVGIPLNDLQVQPAEDIGNELNESLTPNRNNMSIFWNFLRSFVICEQGVKELYITMVVIVSFAILTVLIYYLMKTKKVNSN